VPGTQPADAELVLTVVKNSAAYRPRSRGPKLDDLRPPNGTWKSTPAVSKLTMTIPASALRRKWVACFRLVLQMPADRLKSVSLATAVGEQGRRQEMPVGRLGNLLPTRDQPRPFGCTRGDVIEVLLQLPHHGPLAHHQVQHARRQAL
jgi:hypothetical protein